MSTPWSAQKRQQRRRRWSRLPPALSPPARRRWDSWRRHTTLVMLAHAILTVIAARERANRHDQSLILLSLNEIRRLLAKLAIDRSITAQRVCDALRDHVTTVGAGVDDPWDACAR